MSKSHDRSPSLVGLWFILLFAGALGLAGYAVYLELTFLFERSFGLGLVAVFALPLTMIAAPFYMGVTEGDWTALVWTVAGIGWIVVMTQLLNRARARASSQDSSNPA